MKLPTAAPPVNAVGRLILLTMTRQKNATAIVLATPKKLVVSKEKFSKGVDNLWHMVCKRHITCQLHPGCMVITTKPRN